MSANSIRLAVDAMGADLGPAEVVAGVKLALSRPNPPAGITLVGDGAVILPLLRQQGLANEQRVTHLQASEVIGPAEKPVQALKQKRDASLARAIETVKSGECAAAVSCGNTGALMACATLRLRPMEGVTKPALGTVWPSKDHHFVLLDAGANPQCKPENLAHYAVLGHHFARQALALAHPRVGLLTIGTEEGKGTELTAETHRVLKKLAQRLNYVGLVEGFDMFRNEVDVVVTDGFTGNVLLKSCEGLWKMLRSLLREEVKRNPVRMLGAVLLRGAYKGTRQRLDPERYGGAPLLGLRGTVIKAHGSSSRVAVAHAIAMARDVAEDEMNAQLPEDIEFVNSLIRAETPVSANP